MNNNRGAQGLLLENNSAPLPTGLRGYFLWNEGSDVTVIGNTVANSTREHVIRMANSQRVLVAYNTFTNLDRTAVDRDDRAKGCIVVQNQTSYVYVAHNYVKDGGIGVGPLGIAGATVQYPSEKQARSRWVVVDSNTLEHATLVAEHGAEEVVFRNNVIRNDNGVCIVVKPYSAEYDRQVLNLQIVNNTGINQSADGQFLRVDGKAQGLVLANNLYVAPNLVTGNGAAVVYVTGSDLSSFQRISNNVWPIPKTTGYAEGGYHYLWPNWSDPKGYQTPQEWGANAPVQHEMYLNVQLQDGYQVSVDGITAGANLN